MNPFRSSLCISTALVVFFCVSGAAVSQEKVTSSVPQSTSAAPSQPLTASEIAEARMKGAYIGDLQRFLSSRDDWRKPFYRALFVEGERNAVLNFDRLGLIELEHHNVQLAGRLFDAAALRINAIYAGDPNAEKAKSLWNSEAVKDFKGEPYERAMTFYYRGLGKLMLGDYENARANFTAAEQQTLVSESEVYKTSSFAALTYLRGWASHCAGDEADAAEKYRLALKANPNLTVPDAGDNLLILSEVGFGPSKIRQGKNGETLHMLAGRRTGAYSAYYIEDRYGHIYGADGKRLSKIQMHDFKGFTSAKTGSLDPYFDRVQNNLAIHSEQASNISLQSMMRDGRPVDTILHGKAQFKSTASGLGTLSLVSGMALLSASNHSSTSAIGAGLAIFGLVSKIAGAAADASADIRTWDTLPGALDFATARQPKKSFRVMWFISGSDGSSLRMPAPMMTSSGGMCAIAWAREFPAAANPVPASALETRVSSDRLARDARFRAMLLSDFSK